MTVPYFNKYIKEQNELSAKVKLMCIKLLFEKNCIDYTMTISEYNKNGNIMILRNFSLWMKLMEIKKLCIK